MFWEPTTNNNLHKLKVKKYLSILILSSLIGLGIKFVTQSERLGQTILRQITESIRDSNNCSKSRHLDKFVDLSGETYQRTELIRRRLDIFQPQKQNQTFYEVSSRDFYSVKHINYE